MIVKRCGAGVALLLAALVASVPAVAEARGKPGGGPGGGAGSTVSLVLLDPSDDHASFGEQVTFAVTSKSDARWVTAVCSQAGTVVYTETRGFYPEYPWGQTYTLGPTGMWTGGAATCTAELFTVSGKKRVSLATTSFDVSA